jgi:hypothetical protein
VPCPEMRWSEPESLQRTSKPSSFRTPERGPYPGGEFVGGERLDDVVVEPCFEALYDVLLALPRSEHDDRQGGEIRVRTLTECPDELQPVYPGHQAVSDQEIGNVPALQQVQRFLAILDIGYLLAEPVEFSHHYPPHHPVVVGNQDFHPLRIQRFASSLYAHVQRPSLLASIARTKIISV